MMDIIVYGITSLFLGVVLGWILTRFYDEAKKKEAESR